MDYQINRHQLNNYQLNVWKYVQVLPYRGYKHWSTFGVPPSSERIVYRIWATALNASSADRWPENRQHLLLLLLQKNKKKKKYDDGSLIKLCMMCGYTVDVKKNIK